MPSPNSLVIHTDQQRIDTVGALCSPARASIRRISRRTAIDAKP